MVVARHCARFIPTRVGNTSLSVTFIAILSVHPHTRGEHGSDHEVRPRIAGSSPHAWGTHFLDRPQSRCRRFIPTRVGNTLLGPGREWSKPVHPHTRGEHLRKIVLSLYPSGSSPHAWGTLPSGSSALSKLRFIPTRVGNTPYGRISGSDWSVHPHTRGEHTSSTSLNYRQNSTSS